MLTLPMRLRLLVVARMLIAQLRRRRSSPALVAQGPHPRVCCSRDRRQPQSPPTDSSPHNSHLSLSFALSKVLTRMFEGPQGHRSAPYPCSFLAHRRSRPWRTDPPKHQPRMNQCRPLRPPACRRPKRSHPSRLVRQWQSSQRSAPASQLSFTRMSVLSSSSTCSRLPATQELHLSQHQLRFRTSRLSPFSALTSQLSTRVGIPLTPAHITSLCSHLAAPGSHLITSGSPLVSLASALAHDSCPRSYDHIIALPGLAALFRLNRQL
ncbi:hypothetical protein V8E36_008796 [Tilletia maclaganii]